VLKSSTLEEWNRGFRTNRFMDDSPSWLLASIEGLNPTRGIDVCLLQPPAHAGSTLADFSTLKMEAIRSSETSVNPRSTQRHIPEDNILQFLAYLTAPL
jgi:hypothetical protein